MRGDARRLPNRTLTSCQVSEKESSRWQAAATPCLRNALGGGRREPSEETSGRALRCVASSASCRELVVAVAGLRLECERYDVVEREVMRGAAVDAAAAVALVDTLALGTGG